jgi:hypothetical protein
MFPEDTVAFTDRTPLLPECASVARADLQLEIDKILVELPAQPALPPLLREIMRHDFPAGKDSHIPYPGLTIPTRIR